jgi:serine/threonine-protein kinase
LTKREGAVSPSEPARFDPVPGTVVAGKYRVERTLGEGGMGLVVAATHLGLDQAVAIKFLLPEATRSRVAVERFLREARVAAKVRSEHVARVHDVGTLDSGVPYIVMEYLVGSDLGQLIGQLGQGGALPIDETCEILLQASEALAEVHAAGIVHRDLKPSNLFVTRRADGSPAVKLLDFGISKLTFGGDEPAVDPALTATATIMGSPSYMSPEQLKSTKEVDPRTDVWSLGAVLYEALTGKPAFRGETVPQVCAMIASEEPVLPSALREGIPLELEHAVLGTLEKDVAKRIPLVELAHALARFAPERTKPSLERIEAVLGSPPRSRADMGAPPRSPSRFVLPALPLATSEKVRTMSAWGRRDGPRSSRPRGGGEKERRSRGGFLLALVIAVVGACAIAVLTAPANVRLLRGEIAGATSAVASAERAVASAERAAVSAAASGLPEIPSLPSALPQLPLPSALPPIPLPSALPLPTFEEPGDANADAGDEVDDEDEPAAPAHSGMPRGPAGGPPAHPGPAKAHAPGKPKHVTKHRKHP